MKTLPTLIFALCATATVTAANTATKCVAQPSCSSGSGSGADWSKTCSANGTTMSVKGVAICSSKSGTSTGDSYETANALTLSSTTTANKYCWCKMVSPAVSKWVYIWEASTNSLCNTSCANTCSGSNSMSYYTQALFSNLSD